MAQIGDQRHSRPALRRHISITDISPPRNRQSFVKSRTNAIAVAFVVLIVVLFLVFTFGRTASIKAASSSSAVDYHPSDNGEGFAVDMPEPQLRGSEKEDTIRANMESSSGSGESDIIKARLNSREGNQEVDIVSIAQSNDAASKAADAAVKAEIEAVAAVKEDRDTFTGVDLLEELWDVSGENA